MYFKSYKVLFALIIIFLLSSCKKDPDPDPSVVGFWAKSKKYSPFIEEISADGYIYTHILDINSQPTKYFRMTDKKLSYKLEGNKVIGSYKNGVSDTLLYKYQGDTLLIQGSLIKEDIVLRQTLYRVPAPTFK